MQTGHEAVQQRKTGYSVVRVKEQTKARLEQLQRQTQTTTEDELLALLIEHYTESLTTDQQKSEI